MACLCRNIILLMTNALPVSPACEIDFSFDFSRAGIEH